MVVQLLQICARHGIADLQRADDPVDRLAEVSGLQQHGFGPLGFPGSPLPEQGLCRTVNQPEAGTQRQQRLVRHQEVFLAAGFCRPITPIDRVHEIKGGMAAEKAELRDAVGLAHITTIAVDVARANPYRPPAMESTPTKHQPAVFTRAGVWEGMKLTVPFSISALPFGLAFGAAAVGASVSPGEAILMSALVFAGSAQFAVLGLWSAPLPVTALILTALLVNARHVVMGAALHPFIANLPRRLVFAMSGGMTDAGWAITLQAMMRGRNDLGILFGTIVMQWPIWVGGTALGALIGTGGVDPKRVALDVLIAGVFATSVVGLFRGRGDLVPWLSAVAGTAAAILWLPGNWYILIGGICAGLAGLWRHGD